MRYRVEKLWQAVKIYINESNFWRAEAGSSAGVLAISLAAKKRDEEKKKREGENEDTGTLIHDAAPNYMRVHSNA